MPAAPLLRFSPCLPFIWSLSAALCSESASDSLQAGLIIGNNERRTSSPDISRFSLGFISDSNARTVTPVAGV